MGANEKNAATYHGGQYTPSTEAVRAIFSHHRDAGMEAYNAGIFDRWLETVRAEAKAEAWEEGHDAGHMDGKATYTEFTDNPYKDQS